MNRAKFNKNDTELIKLIDDGFIKINTHPELDLAIYNYTATCQFKKNGISIL